MKIKLSNVRISFPNLFQAKSINDGPARFGASFLMSPDDKNLKGVEAAVEAVGKEKWKDKWSTVKKQLVAQDRLPTHDGDMKEYEGYEGMVYLSANDKNRPKVVDRMRNPIQEQDGIIYGGCYVTAVIDIWAQDNQYGKRINASLKGVQFYADGEALGGSAPASDDDFDDLDDLDLDLDDDIPF